MLQRVLIIAIGLIAIVICYRIDFNLKDSDIPGTDFYKVGAKKKSQVHSTTLRDTDEVGGSFEGYADFEDYQDYDYYGYPTDDYESASGNETYDGSEYDSQVSGASTIKDKDNVDDKVLSDSQESHVKTPLFTPLFQKYTQISPQVSSPTEVTRVFKMNSDRTQPKS